MAYQVLARKYRPQRFSDVKGQEHVTRTLLNALTQNRIAHGYIFSGHRGIGKTTIARILAKALNCRTEIGSAQRPTPEPCDICESCTEIRAGNAVDVIEIDAATNRGIDEIRELRDAARYRPARDRYKIYILDEAHQITDAAFNALLKTLEEPPDHVIFMMATTQPEDIPQTIRSRCQHFSFHAVRFSDILEQLREIAAAESVIANEAALALLAEAGDGSMRDALSIMDQAIASAPIEASATGEAAKPHLEAAQIFELMGTVPNTVFERLLEAVSENQSAAVIEEINRLLNAGNSPSQLARQLVRYLRNCLMARLGGEATELLQVSPDERARAARTALLFSEEDLTRYLDIMLRTFDQLNYRQEQRFHLELGLLKLVHMQRLLPMEQFLSQLPQPAGGTKVSAPGPLGGHSVRPASSTSSGMVPEPSEMRVPQVSPFRPGTATSSATPTGVVPPSAPPSAPVAPAFSPFEADRSRKSTMEDRPRSRPEPSSEGATQHSLGNLTPLARELTPIESAARAAQSPAGGTIPSLFGTAALGTATLDSYDKTDPTASASIETSGRLPMLGEVSASAPFHSTAVGISASLEMGPSAVAVKESPEEVSAPSAPLEPIRNAVCAALESEGHNTAAALLSAGTWAETGDAIRVEVNIKKTMLGLTMNPEAEKICKAAVAEATSASRNGAPVPRFTVISADGSVAGAQNGNGPNRSGQNGAATKSGAQPARPPASGSVQAEALANPLVQEALELFSAEVRHIHDLRKR